MKPKLRLCVMGFCFLPDSSNGSTLALANAAFIACCIQDNRLPSTSDAPDTMTGSPEMYR